METERIEDIVCEILYRDGPDRHVDGYDILTAFIDAVQHGEGEQWFTNYLRGHKRFL